MKRALLSILMVTMLVISGCGDGSVAVYVPIGPVDPSITSYSFGPGTLYGYINGSVDFLAPDSDIDTITVVVVNSSNVPMSRTDTRANLPVGTTSGRIPFSIDYNTYPSGTYYFTVYVTDFNRNISNSIADKFLVP